jgi:hypothetical protein
MVIGEKIAHPCPSGKSVLKIHHTKPHPNIGGVMRGHCHWVFNGEKNLFGKQGFCMIFTGGLPKDGINIMWISRE